MHEAEMTHDIISKVENYDLSPALKEKVSWFRRRLRGWFKKNRRHFPWRDPERSLYEILVAEIMLRQTKAGTVAQIYPLFLAKYPDFSHLSKAPIEDLQEAIKPLGLWRQKAAVFLEVAQAVLENDGQLPSSRKELESLMHIGQYISSVILTTFHGKAEPFIDVNTARVVDRFFGPRKLVDIRYDPYLKAISSLIVKNPRESLTLNWAILDFAALVCKAIKPLCPTCPMKSNCLYFQKQISIQEIKEYTS